MAYTDMTSAWAYRQLVTWQNLDLHADNSHVVWVELSNPNASRHENGTGQSLSATTWTLQTNDTEDFDPNSVMSSSRFSPARAGMYLVSSEVATTKASINDRMKRAAIYKNGSVFAYGESAGGEDFYSTLGGSASAITLVELTESDYLEGYAWSQEASTMDNSNHGQPTFSVIRLNS